MFKWLKRGYQFFLMLLSHIHRVGLFRFFKHIFTRLQQGQLTQMLATSNVIYKKTQVYEYREWAKKFDRLSPQQRLIIDNTIREFTNKPLISVVMPVYNPQLNLLTEAIESIEQQLYPHWELCIADDASTNPEVRQTLESYQKKNPSIKVVFREQNGHISKASNSALELVKGEFVILFDQDDVLAIDALYEVAKVINGHPHIQLIYSDEDKIDIDNHRFDGYLKSNWNYYLFLSQNMFSHMGAFSTELIRYVGGFRAGFEGSQDYDLTLRCIQKITAEQIYHIPKVLYHWRAIPGSTAVSKDEKPYAKEAAVKALNEYLAASDINATAGSRSGNYYRIHYHLPQTLPMVSILIYVNKENRSIVSFLENLLKDTDYQNYEIILIGEWPENLENLAEKYPLIRLLNLQAQSMVTYYSCAIEQAKGDYIVLLSDDLVSIESSWLAEMLSHAIQKNIAAVGAKLIFSDNKVHHAGIIMGLDGIAGLIRFGIEAEDPSIAGLADLQQQFLALSQDCMMFSRKCFEQVGGFSVDKFPEAYFGIDLCLKFIQAGFINTWTPYAVLKHRADVDKHSKILSERYLNHTLEKENMLEQWKNYIDNDPYFHPAFSRWHLNPTLVNPV